MMTISVIIGSTRQGRLSEKPAQWILQQLRKREGVEAQLLDLGDFPMLFFDQPMPPAMPGRPLAFRAISEEQLRAGLTRAGLPVGAVNTVISIQASFAASAFDIVTGDVERLGGRPPKSLRDVLAGALKSPSAGTGEEA
jgi:hypothetical protein